MGGAPHICPHGPPPRRGVVLLAGRPEVDAPPGGGLARGRDQNAVREVMGPLRHHKLPIPAALVSVAPSAGATRNVSRLHSRDHTREGPRGPRGAEAAVGGAQVADRVGGAGSPIVVHPVLVVLAIRVQVDLELHLHRVGTTALLLSPGEPLNSNDITQEPIEALRGNHRSAVLGQGVRGRNGGDDPTQRLNSQVVEPRQRGRWHVTEDHEIPKMRAVLSNIHHKLRPRRGRQLLGVAPGHLSNPRLALQGKEQSLVIPRVRLLLQRV
mmetsp:Transcript_53800/g.122344  ORF Transcript_53800/g.122344 Transcript_53800/m.122344 type:complete len:268 (-) Transcript_53800:1293-2096(-)